MFKLIRNVAVAIITKILLIVAGIVAQRFILHSFGSEINGLTSSITQFLSYFTLLEAGLGLASIQALYKPLAEKDQTGIDRILSATSVQYRRIGFVFLGLTVALAVVMPFIVNSSLDYALIFCITLLMGFGNILNYLFIGRYQVLLSADRKIYVIHTLDAVLGIAFSLIRVLLINAGCSIIQVQSAALLSPLVRIAVLYIYVKRQYPGLSYKAQPDFSSLSKRKNVLVHQIVGMVTNHTDVTILTVFATLKHVSVYSIYNLIYYNISQVISTTFSNAAQASFGRLVEKKDRNLLKYYELYETVFTCVLFCLLSVVLVMTVPFVKLYTDGITDVEYADTVLAFLFMVSILFSTVRIPAITMVNVTGRFKETQKGAIIEAVINIAVSIPAFVAFGLRGLLFGTCVAMLYRALDLQVYTYRKIFNKKLRNWLLLIGLNSLLMALFLYLFLYRYPIEVTGWYHWLGSGIAYSFFGILFFGSVCGIVYHKKLIEAYRFIRTKRKRAVDSSEA